VRPSLLLLVPTRIAQEGGTAFELTGRGFDATIDLDFNGTFLDGLATIDGTTAMGTAPAGAVSGPLFLASGGVRSRQSIFFFSQRTPDTTAPVVVAVDPPDGAAGVPTTTVVTVNVSELVSLGSFFSLSDGIDQVDGRIMVTVQGTNAVLTLIPFAPLLPGRQYTVTVSQGVIDLSGNPLDQDLSAPGAQAFLSYFTTQ
jgi:hypothetical protein